MHVVFIIAALALALAAGFSSVRPGHGAGSPPIVTPFDGGGDGSGSGSGGTFNGSGPPG
jgi:hypothetical protein